MVQVTRYSFTVDEYNRMGAAGIFPDGVRTELIEGEIVEMAPIGSHHLSTVIALSELFIRALTPERATVSVQGPLELSDRSEPEPDVLVLARRADHYREHIPGTNDVYLLIEVSDSSIQWDRDVKLPLYAREGIQEVWIVDLHSHAIQVFRAPRSGAYTDVHVASRGAVVSPQAFPDMTISVTDLLGS